MSPTSKLTEKSAKTIVKDSGGKKLRETILRIEKE